MSILGKLITTRRKQLGLQQKQLAARLNNRDEKALSATYLNYIESGRGLPPDYLLEQIAANLKLPPEVLYFLGAAYASRRRADGVHRRGSHHGGV